MTQNGTGGGDIEYGSELLRGNIQQ